MLLEMLEKNNKNGFTLIEMLLVLMISSITIQLSISPAHQLISKISEKEMIEQIKADIYLAQTIAITSKKRTEVIFEEDEFQVIIDGNVHYTETYPPSMKIVQVEKFQFLPESGHINRFTTVFMNGGAQNYKWIFQIGKGRFRVEET